MSEAVLDASALLALLQGEPGAERVAAALPRAAISGVNPSEVVAKLRPATRARGLSLADRACLALARRLDAKALTADRAWLGLEVGVVIEAIR